MTPLRAVLARCLRGLPTAVPDRDLLRAAADGDADAFRALVERHGPMVLRLCRRWLGDRHAAEDAFQATFLILARKAGALRRPEALAAWLFGVARRVASKARSADARRHQREARVVSRPPPDPLDELTARELFDALDDELARLPERYRLPLLLVYWQGLTQDEAARRLGWTPGSVKGRLERGRARLAQRLTRRGFAPSALLVAPLATAAVPADLLARTAALAADPWSRALPATVLALAATAAPAKLLPAVALGILFVSAGLLASAWQAGSVSDRSESQPPVADAPGSPANPQPAAPRLDRFGDPLPAGAVLRLGTTRFRVPGLISHPTVLPGGRQVAMNASMAVVVMDIDTGQTVRRFSFTRRVDGREDVVPLNTLAYAPDGRTFAVGCRDNGPGGQGLAPFWLCDAATGERLREFPGHYRWVNALAFLVGGRQIASFGADGVVRVWDAGTGAEIRKLSAEESPAAGVPGLTSMAASPDGRTLAAGNLALRGDDAVVYLWDAASGERLHVLPNHSTAVNAVAFSPDGHTLASGDQATVRLWDVATGRELRQLHGHAKGARNYLTSLVFSPDGRAIASTGFDRTVRVWSVATGQPLDDTTSAYFPWHALAFLDARTLLVGSRSTLLLRDVAARSFKNRDTGAEGDVAHVSFAPDGRTVMTADYAAVTHTWDASDGRLVSARRLPNPPTSSLLSPDGRLAAIIDRAGDGTVVQIADVATGRILHWVPEADQLPGAFSPDGRRLVTYNLRPKSADAPNGSIWDTGTGAKITQFRSPGQSSHWVFASDGRSLFESGRGHPIRQWDIATGTIVREYKTNGPDDDGTPEATVLAVSPDGRLLAFKGRGPTIRLLDAVTGREQWSAGIAGALSINVMAFSPDGSLLAVGYLGEQHQLDLLDARTGQRLARLRVDTVRSVVVSLAFSPDGRRLASGSADGTALVWDVKAVSGRRAGAPPG